MILSDNYILVERLEELPQEGFKTVEVQDSFVYKGKVKQLPDRPAYLGNTLIAVGQTVVWKKYSPDEYPFEGDKLVFIADLLLIL